MRLIRPQLPLFLAMTSFSTLFSVLLGCRDLTGRDALPAGTQDPAFYHTPAGARGMRTAAIAALQKAIVHYIDLSGQLTDELQSSRVGASPGQLLGQPIGPGGSLDERSLPALSSGGGTSADVVYNDLQKVRGHVQQALGALAAYDSAGPAVLRGELYALEGYAEILLADFFCSGVPLSTLDFEADYTYHASSTTTEVYRDALAKLDSALALSTASDSVLNLARVLKGRAWLDLGQYDSAAAAVASVPEGFQYRIELSGKGATDINGGCNPNVTVCVNGRQDGDSVSDREGINGLPFLSNGDPRTAAMSVTQPNGTTTLIPRKYAAGLSHTYIPFVVADGIEARLIQAEVALQKSDPTWRTMLNTLRTNGTGATVPADTIADTLGITGCGGENPLCGNSGPDGLGGSTPDFGQPQGGFPVPAGYHFAVADTTDPAPDGILDDCNNRSWYIPCYAGNIMVVFVYISPAHTSWAAGTGGVSGLAPLADPGNDVARTNLLFAERAAWFYLTGHRQSDLRRLITWYNRPQDQVYPTGPYTAPGTGFYGNDVTAPIPSAQYTNPLFHGCLSRD